MDGSIFVRAARNGNVETIKKMLKEGFKDIDFKYVNNWTALMLASQNGHTDIVQALLEANADSNADPNADPNAKDCNNFTALMYAIWDRNINNIKLLLKYGADVSIISDEKYTVLMYSRRVKGLYNSGKIFKLLSQYIIYVPFLKKDKKKLPYDIIRESKKYF
jgi:ankyrin repeat protein